MLFTLYVQVLKVEPPVDLFVRLLTDTVCARPGLRTLYDNVLALKAQGLVHSIFMCTAARDSLGWVSFLKIVLEKWYGRKIYDNVVEGEGGVCCPSVLVKILPPPTCWLGPQNRSNRPLFPAAFLGWARRRCRSAHARCTVVVWCGSRAAVVAATACGPRRRRLRVVDTCRACNAPLPCGWCAGFVLPAPLHEASHGCH